MWQYNLNRFDVSFIRRVDDELYVRRVKFRSHGGYMTGLVDHKAAERMVIAFL